MKSKLTVITIEQDRICNGSIETSISSNQKDFNPIKLSWNYNINDSTLIINFKYNSSDVNETVVLTLVPFSSPSDKASCYTFLLVFL